MNKASTVGELIKQLQDYQQDSRITNEFNEPFVHIVNQTDGSIILSTQRPVAICSRSGGYVYPTTTPTYWGYSPELDEDVMRFETEPLPKKEEE